MKEAKMDIDEEAEKMAEEDAIKIFSTTEKYQCTADNMGFNPQEISVIQQIKIGKTDYSNDHYLLLPIDFAEALITQYFSFVKQRGVKK